MPKKEQVAQLPDEISPDKDSAQPPDTSAGYDTHETASVSSAAMEQVDTAVEPTEALGSGVEQSVPGDAQSTAGVEETTEPLKGAAPSPSSLSTTPLHDADAVIDITPSALDAGALVGERYEVVSLINNTLDANNYRVLDTQGYRRCWACGTGNSLPGDIYCAECGAELAGRHYRLQEFFATLDLESETGPPIPVPPPILGNEIAGVSHVYDTLQSSEDGVVYVVWEEDSGQLLSSWLPGSDTTHTDALGEEQVLTWMAQAAEVLSQLHSHAIVGCPLTLQNLLVQPGDRLIMLDPTGCILADTGDEQERQAAQVADIRNLATELERLYMAVRDMNDKGGVAGAREQSSVVMTGPLPNAANPAVVLTEAKEGVYPTAEDFARALKSLYEASKPQTDLLLWSGRASDVGRVRQINEDSVMTLEATALEHEGNLPVGLYVIADGMGGHQSGEVASSIAARTVGAVINSSLLASMVSGDPVAHDPSSSMTLLRQAVLEANRRISELARERHSDLGTTLVAALVIGNQLTVANVGDSRAYVWHDGQISPITKDHSLVAQLVEAGQITRDEIYTHPRRNEIYRALGDARIGEDEVDVFSHRLQPGDSLLLCSDGLWDFVRDPDISSILSSSDNDPQSLANALVAQANMNGGEDNISVVFARVMESET